MFDKIFYKTNWLSKSVNATWTRNETISQNIANVDTPGYKRKIVSFEQALNDAINNQGFRGLRTDARHIPIGNSNIEDVGINVSVDNKDLSMRLDGNNVDIDVEMAEMAKNSIKYNTLVQKLSGEFTTLKSVIREGK